MNQHPRVVESRNRPLRAVVLTVVVLVALTLAVKSIGFPSFGNPFGTKTVDRSAPPLLKSLTDLARFQAASGTYQVVVDLEKDVSHVPSLIAGERTLFLAQGSVDSYVDFAKLDATTVRTGADGSSVDITLPRAALSAAHVDPGQSRVVSRKRGVLDRIGGIFEDDPTSERELYRKAQDEMSGAANSSGLTERAEQNTRTMLTNLLKPLGYTDVRVHFVDDVRP